MAAAQATSEEPVISPLTAWSYRHQARRLRHHFRHDPVGLHISLKALAVKANQASGKPDEALWTSRPRMPATRANKPEPARPTTRAKAGAAPLQDQGPDPVRDTAAALLTPEDAAEKFSVLVRTMLGEGILRYSRRKVLMRQAKKLGIRPFEASLLIATVENRMQEEPNKPYSLRPTRRWSVIAGVISLLILEAAVVGLLAMMLL